MAVDVLNPRKRRVFESVFGSSEISLPTPHATPVTGFTAPGQSWGGPPPGSIDEKLRTSQTNLKGLKQNARPLFSEVDESVEDQVKWDRAWHLVTLTLSVPEFQGDGTKRELLRPTPDQLDDKFYAALERVISPATFLPRARRTENVVVWFTAQVCRDFLHQVLPILVSLTGQYAQEQLLARCIKTLEMANRQYFHGFWFVAQGIENVAPGESTEVTNKFRRDFHAIVSNSVMEYLGAPLAGVLRGQVFKVLGVSTNSRPKTSGIQAEGAETEKARQEMLGLVEALQSVGLAGESFQVFFAEIMNDVMTQYVHQGYKGVWTPNDSAKSRSEAEGRESILPRTAHHNSPSRCVTQLCEWVEDRYAKLAVQVFGALKIKGGVTWADKEKYKEMGMGRLAELRINELFDIVVNWPQSSGALDDLRTAITTPRRRLHLTEVFAKTLQERLLHPGTSTLKILQTYISMIWSFHALDHSKVLLDRVAYPLQLYLFSREDTVWIIINGLLAETRESNGKPVETNGEKLVEVAHLLQDGLPDTGANDEELDWHDMDWAPDPVDAGPGYKRSKNADVIGTLIGVLGTQEVFIKEFQNIIGEYLIQEHQHTVFKREELVLKLLIQRFGETPLQACEVMIKDIYDSVKVTNQIRFKLQDQIPAPISGNHLPNPLQFKDLAMETKILSRLFWPSVNDEQFKVPPPIVLRQESYEKHFEQLKSGRKLTWLPALGQATVELEFADRKVVEDVHTWQATVIYAFNSAEGSTGPVTKTAEELEEQLEMDADLIISALRFWVQKRVLYSPTPSTYAVLETLSSQAPPLAQHAQHAPSSHPREEAAKKGISAEKDGIYWSFVKGMLTNSQKEMQAAQIGMMLKMMLPDKFPYGNEELVEWLGEKAKGGELEFEKGKYRLKR